MTLECVLVFCSQIFFPQRPWWSSPLCQFMWSAMYLIHIMCEKRVSVWLILFCLFCLKTCSFTVPGGCCWAQEMYKCLLFYLMLISLSEIICLFVSFSSSLSPLPVFSVPPLSSSSSFFSLLVFQVIELPVKHPELFDSLGIEQPKVSSLIVSSYFFVVPLVCYQSILVGDLVDNFSDLGILGLTFSFPDIFLFRKSKRL